MSVVPGPSMAVRRVVLQSRMATIKLKKPAGAGSPPPSQDRRPVRGSGAGAKGARPTLAQAQAQRAERDARYQEQLRQRAFSV
jgi:23S rRNA pseudouridine2604 synthase